MNGNKSTDYWDKKLIDNIRKLNNHRNLVSRAICNSLESFFLQNAASPKKILQIGSAIGFLGRHLPEEYVERLYQLDSQHFFLKEAFQKDNSGNYICGSVYDLPFPDNRFDIVGGWNIFSVLYDLDKSLNESWRVLDDNGLFFHFIDSDLEENVKIQLMDTIKSDFGEKGYDYSGWTDTNVHLVDRTQALSQINKITYYSALENFVDAEQKVKNILFSARLEVNIIEYMHEVIKSKLEKLGAKKITLGIIEGYYEGEMNESQKKLGLNGSYKFVKKGPSYWKDPFKNSSHKCIEEMSMPYILARK